MGAIVTYVKSKVTAAYVCSRSAVSYSKIVAFVYASTAELIELVRALADTTTFSETGYLAAQDYVDPSYFLTGDYVADQYRTF